MDNEKMELIAKKFKEAYDWRADETDVDWKDTGRAQLAYLNWAVAWRKMKEVYPDANYRLIDHDGDPLWNINGYGMLKCAVSALGVEYVETFPIMDNRNNAMQIESITARDVNDSMQRGLTKAIARFGVGLYIYEGKLEMPSQVKAKFEERRKELQEAQSVRPMASYQKASQPQQGGYKPYPPTEKQRSFMNKLLDETNMSLEDLKTVIGKDPLESASNAKSAIDALIAVKSQKQAPKPLKKEAQAEEETGIIDDDLPF